MALGKRYNSVEIEEKWAKKWVEEKTFAFKPGKRNFIIDHPPAFTSGTLHMGHVLDYSWIDFVARLKRMKGFNVLLPIGFDCHGLPTELKVEKKFGIGKDDRMEFIRACQRFTRECIEKMSEQYKKLGYSCDWDSLYITMSDEYKKFVQLSLLIMFREGLVYRASHPIPWCTQCQTALAKAEIGYIEKQGDLFYIKVGSEREFQIATTRPEFLPACVAIFVHPEDKRYKDLIGKKAKLPVTGSEVPILTDKEVDMEFGTGAVYLCTYGDEQDIKWREKYKLPEKIIIDKSGTFTASVLKGFGMEKAKKRIIELLKEENALVKVEPIKHSVLCHTERSSCRNPIEFIPIPQYFIKIKKFVKETMENGRKIKWYPDFLRAHLIDWARNMNWDWIVSRQRTFGTPIPFWHCTKCGKIYAPDEKVLPVNPSKEELNKKCRCGGMFEGSRDVCDCWVDSSITPLVVSKWKTDERFFRETYPNAIRIQGYEIIRTWLFYTLFRCYRLTGKIPWYETLQHGNVLGEDGKKMSKSYGNVIDPDEAFEKYGADALRQWAATATQGEDLVFTWKEMEHGKRFLNKLWNISRFIEMNVKGKPEKQRISNPIDRWILSSLNALIDEMNKNFENYVFNVPIQRIRAFLWHEFADYYIEMVKYRLQRGDKAARYVLYKVLNSCIRMLAPFIPFITEEIYENLFRKYEKKKSVHLLDFPKADKKLINRKIERVGEIAKDIVSAIRKYKNAKNMPMNAKLDKIIIGSKQAEPVLEDIKGTVRAKEIEIGKARQLKTEVFRIGIVIK